MAFTVGNIAAKDGAGTTIGGGLLAADIAGGGVGPWFLYHGLVDGVAGSNKAAVTSGNALKVDASATTQPVTLTSTTITGTVAVTESGTWSNRITDGTNTAAVKAASTAPVASDPALVVAISPNGVNANGQAVAANSAPVVLPSDATPYALNSNLVSGVITSAMTGTTSTSLVAAPGASLRNFITQITVSNAHATQGTDMIVQDGSGGTTLYTIPAAAVYGGAAITFPAPLRQPTTNTAIYIANVTSGASTKASASGFKGA